jgi:hypothetical protein
VHELSSLSWSVRRGLLVEERASGAWGGISASILSLEALFSATGGAKHKGLAPITILVNGKEVMQGEVTQENADPLHMFDFKKHLRPGPSNCSWREDRR